MKLIVRSYSIVYVQKVSDTKYNKRFGTIRNTYLVTLQWAPEPRHFTRISIKLCAISLIVEYHLQSYDMNSAMYRCTNMCTCEPLYTRNWGPLGDDIYTNCMICWELRLFELTLNYTLKTWGTNKIHMAFCKVTSGWCFNGLLDFAPSALKKYGSNIKLGLWQSLKLPLAPINIMISLWDANPNICCSLWTWPTSLYIELEGPPITSLDFYFL